MQALSDQGRSNESTRACYHQRYSDADLNGCYYTKDNNLLIREWLALLNVVDEDKTPVHKLGYFFEREVPFFVQTAYRL